MEDDVDKVNNVLNCARNECGQYTTPHPKSETHVCVQRFKNHIYLCRALVTMMEL